MERSPSISRIALQSMNIYGKEKLNSRSFASDYETKIFLSTGSSWLLDRSNKPKRTNKSQPNHEGSHRVAPKVKLEKRETSCNFKTSSTKKPKALRRSRSIARRCVTRSARRQWTN